MHKAARQCPHQAGRMRTEPCGHDGSTLEWLLNFRVTQVFCCHSARADKQTNRDNSIGGEPCCTKRC
eukprot:4506559-Amphidinium_carterae.1